VQALLSHTHSLISQIILSNIKEESGTNLDEKRFSWGSVKPDLVLPPFRPKHYMDETLDDILEQIMDLIETDEISVDKFSVKMGAVTHFLTDFFTLPHSERWEWIKSGRTIEHIVYEKKLKKVAQSNPQLIQPMLLGMKRDWTKAELREWIIFQHERYQQGTGFEQDLVFACSISQSVTEWVLKKRLCRNQNM
jgi:hypothetical protein